MTEELGVRREPPLEGPPLTQQALARRTLVAAGPVGGLRAWQLVLLAVVVAGSALGFCLSVVSTFYANGLDALPPEAVGGGAYPPGDLPYPPSLATEVVGGLTLLLTPLSAGLGAFAVLVDLLFSPARSWRDDRLRLSVLAVCVAVLGAYLAVGRLAAWWTA